MSDRSLNIEGGKQDCGVNNLFFLCQAIKTP